MRLANVLRVIKHYISFSDMSKSEKVSNSIALFSLLISIGAIIYAHDGIEYSLKPVLEIGICNSQTNPEYYGLILQNKGMGTATIEADSIFFDDKLIEQSDAQALQNSIIRLGFGKKRIDFETASTSIYKGKSISVNQELLILTAVKSQIENIDEFNNVLKKISIKLQYYSVSGKNYSLLYEQK